MDFYTVSFHLRLTRDDGTVTVLPRKWEIRSTNLVHVLNSLRERMLKGNSINMVILTHSSWDDVIVIDRDSVWNCPF